MSAGHREAGRDHDGKGEMGGSQHGAAEMPAEMPAKPEGAGKRGEHTPSRAWMQEAASRNSKGTNVARREGPPLLLVTVLRTVETVHGGCEVEQHSC